MIAHALTRAHTGRGHRRMTLDGQLVMLFVLPIPIASIAWTVTHEELFREFRD
jgi:hypothetical protein